MLEVVPIRFRSITMPLDVITSIRNISNALSVAGQALIIKFNLPYLTTQTPCEFMTG